MDPTPAYWPTRIMLAVGIASTAAVVVVSISGGILPAGLSDTRASVVGLPADVVMPVAAVLPTLVGLGWMVRILRGARDEPPAWRYRDRD